MTLIRTGWGRSNPAFRQVFTSLFFPDATAEQVEWFNELQRRSTSPQNAARLMRVLGSIDVLDMLPKVTHPTLVLHALGDQAVPFAEGEILARGIPGARLVPLDSQNHILLEHEPAFQRFFDEAKAFLV